MIRTIIILVALSIAPQSVRAQAAQTDVVSSEELVRRLSESATRSRGILKVSDQSPASPVVFNNILFALNSAILDASSRAQLDELRIALSTPELRDKKFQISGHTDATGEARYNRQLSARRADSVAKYLLSGSDLDQLKLDVVGKGEDEPLPGYDLNDSRQRRVEISIAAASENP